MMWVGPAPERPVPPSFMWSCAECVRRLHCLAQEWGGPDGCLWEQLQVARHIVEAHPEEVPFQHLEECELCPYYADRQDDAAAELCAQHRARALFMPTELARLI